MAPLDTGSVTPVIRLAEAFGGGPGPSSSDFAALGDYLRAVREHKNLSLPQVADATRVRRVYLAAIEANDLTPLPSWPFAIGYVRAYARALGLDGDMAVARFKSEHPDPTGPLRAPVGVDPLNDPRRRVLYAALGIVAVAVTLWNVAQRTLTSEQSSRAVFPASALASPQPAPKGPMQLGAPTPPPADQTTPEPYVTPGLGVPGVDPNATPSANTTGAGASVPNTAAEGAATPDPAPAVAPPPPSPTVFTTRAAVYGAPAKGPTVVIQAKKPAALIIRGGQGAIYFAHQLAVGEAYRAPLGKGLTADVSDPTAFDVYLNGRLQGGLSEPQTPVDKLPQPAPAATPAGAQPAH